MTASDTATSLVSTTYQDDIAWLEFDGSRAFDGTFWSDITEALRSIDTNRVTCVVLFGGPSFAVGNSAAWLSRTVGSAVRRGQDASALIVAGDAPREAARALDSLPVVTIAIVSGEATGAGLELACRCDLRIGIGSVAVRLPEGHLGVLPDLAPLKLLDTVLGARLVRDLLLTGQLRVLDQNMPHDFIDHWASSENDARQHLSKLGPTLATGPILPAIRRANDRHDHAVAAAALNADICSAPEFRKAVSQWVKEQT
ncbi:enoyl-CoA hydratase/isomerase family protein [Rhodococcoides fascians]|uniref:enoyl-CoA hydratase/isomerase family protein n=1 Tax=Rhodococcoides fascians TaxID=1828 RepID=UPI003530008A